MMELKLLRKLFKKMRELNVRENDAWIGDGEVWRIRQWRRG